jgi:hypothetical protein
MQICFSYLRYPSRKVLFCPSRAKRLSYNDQSRQGRSPARGQQKGTE